MVGACEGTGLHYPNILCHRYRQPDHRGDTMKHILPLLLLSLSLSLSLSLVGCSGDTDSKLKTDPNGDGVVTQEELCTLVKKRNFEHDTQGQRGCHVCEREESFDLNLAENSCPFESCDAPPTFTCGCDGGSDECGWWVIEGEHVVWQPVEGYDGQTQEDREALCREVVTYQRDTCP